MRIMVLDEEFPYPTNNGKRTRSFNLYRRLAARFQIRYIAYGEGSSVARSEEHTSALQSPDHLVCRLLLDSSTSTLLSLSLHDALPICIESLGWVLLIVGVRHENHGPGRGVPVPNQQREAHTELQSLSAARSAVSDSLYRLRGREFGCEIGRAHVCTPVTRSSRMPSSA